MIERDNRGKIIIDLNKEYNTEIPIRVLDERYVNSDFKYAVNVGFKSLPNATNAENFVMSKYNSLIKNLAGGLVTSPDNAENLENFTVAEQFFSNIANLININADSTVSQNQKIKQLQQNVEDVVSESQEKDSLLYSQANEIMEKDTAIQQKDKEIELLKESISSLLNNT